MRLALYRPDIPYNVGGVLRLGACMATPVDLIEPMGFAWDDRRVARAGMDYIAHADVTRHADWSTFERQSTGRLVLFTTAATERLPDFTFNGSDILLFGRESAGVPPDVHARADARVAIPMVPHVRSLNLAMSTAIALAEALRQTQTWPENG